MFVYIFVCSCEKPLSRTHVHSTVPVRPLRTIKPRGWRDGGGGEPSSLALSPSPPSGENRAPIGPNCRRPGALIGWACRHPTAVAEYETGGLFLAFFLATVAKEFVLATELQNNCALATILQTIIFFQNSRVYSCIFESSKIDIFSIIHLQQRHTSFLQ